MSVSSAHNVECTNALSVAIQALVNDPRKLAEIRCLGQQDECLVMALKQMEHVVRKIEDPTHILGSQRTKHGEIAEYLEVGVRRARAALYGDVDLDNVATFKGVGRTAPEDYLIGHYKVQSKFINGTNNGLDHVLKHLNTYPDFKGDDYFYNIPKDQFSEIMKLRNGENPQGLSSRTIEGILQKVESIEKTTGKPFEEAVRPGVSDYAEVQIGRVKKTISKHESDFKKENEQRKETIHQAYKASFKEGVKVAGWGAAAGGSMALLGGLYAKHKEGKNVFRGDFSAEDWKELGLGTGKASLAGGASAASLYALTNCVNMSAPLAGAVVSAATGLAPLVFLWREGKLSTESFLDEGSLLCVEVAALGLCTGVGQTLIPIPCVGALLGAKAGKVLFDFLGRMSAEASIALENRSRQAMQRLDSAYQAAFLKISNMYDGLDRILDGAFDLSNNELLLSSYIQFAKAVGVEEKDILYTDEDLKNFFMS